jgi:hypothetical protein
MEVLLDRLRVNIQSSLRDFSSFESLPRTQVLGLEFLHFQGEAAPGSLAVLRF